MDNESINSLARINASARTNESFADLYYAVIPDFRRRWQRRDIDPHEYEEAFNKALTEIAGGWTEDHGDFIKALNIRYKQRVIDQLRKRKRRTDNELSLDEPADDSETGAATPIEDKAVSIEDDVIKKMTESGRQAIIDHLLQSPQTDSATSRIVAVLNPSRFESLTSLGKAAGVHHEIVKRKLRALARNYDERRFGDIRDYLAV